MTIKASGIITLARIDNGSIGPAGVGVSAITGEFYLSTSKTAQSGASWVTTPPAWSSGKYLWTRYKIVYTNGSTSYTTPQCSSEWEAINEIQVGGRNLARGTYSDYNVKETYSAFDGRINTISLKVKVYLTGLTVGDTISVRFVLRYTDILPASGKTAIFYLQGEGDVTGWGGGAFRNSPQNIISGSGEIEVKYQFQVTSDMLKNNFWSTMIRTDYIQSGKIERKEYKVEKGNKYTDWSPAPEDTQDQIDQANENISNKVDQGAYDQDKSVIYDDINKKLDDEEFRKFQQTMNDLKSSYDSFVGEGGRFEQELKNASEREQAIIQNFKDKVNQLNFINTYIRESEEGIVIGAKNSPMQMLLSRDSLSFMDGGQVVAYFSNQSFYINRGAVVESLRVGVHKLTKVGNEHTVIQYIPQ